MYYGSKSGVKVIVDDAVAAGRVMDTTVNLGEAGAAAELVIYPTDAAMGSRLWERYAGQRDCGNRECRPAGNEQPGGGLAVSERRGV